MPLDSAPQPDPLARPTRHARYRPSRRRAAWLAASGVLHAAVLLYLLLGAGQPSTSDGGAPPSYDLVFADPAPDQAAPPEPGTDALVPPAPPDPEAQTNARPPEPDPAPLEPAPLLPQATPEPVPPEVAPPQALPAVPAEIATPEPEPPPPASRPPPSVRLAEPDEPPPLRLPPPVPIQEPPPQAAQPRPRPQQAQRFPAPIDLNFGPANPGRPAPGSVASRAIDLALGPAKPGSSRAASSELYSPNASADLMAALQAWWRRHRYYPEQARRAGEDGSVGIRLQVDRYGRVALVEVNTRSGSQWLDLAAQGTFRGAKLVVPSNSGETVSVDLMINYVLVR